MKEDGNVNHNLEKECYGYWLYNIEGIGNKTGKILLQHFINEENIYLASDLELSRLLNKNQLEHLVKSRENWDLNMRYETIRKKGIRFIPLTHEEYPASLFHIYDPPLGIYVKGKLPNPFAIHVAMIGARSCSPYGKEVAREFAGVLSEFKMEIISGMAYGIDSISQREALKKGGSTFAVLGSGVEVCYPEENKDLYQDIIKSEISGILSEFHPFCKPKPQFFPMRNRIISGLSDVVLVVEAKDKSGTLITVDMALEQGREVFAVPGRVLDSLSYGCNRLLSHGAQIAYDSKEFVQVLLERFPEKAEYHKRCYNQILPGEINQNGQKTGIISPEKENILKCLKLKPLTIDELHDMQNEQSENPLNFSALFQNLMELQLDHIIYCKAGYYFISQ